MHIAVSKARLSDILPLRRLFLAEHKFQIRYDACHVRDWSDSYLTTVDGEAAGYGSVKGKEDLLQRDAVFEFFLLPPYRASAHRIFAELLRVSGARYVESQTNERLLTAQLYAFTRRISTECYLFEDHQTTAYGLAGAVFRARLDEDDLARIRPENRGDYVLEKDGKIVATGGFLLHYNKPFADLHMAVHPGFRRQGWGTLIVQELKKACYATGRTPAARCWLSNQASKATLTKAGMRVCGFMISGEVF